MNKRILESINTICEELEAIGMHKEASNLTDVMVRLSAEKEDKPYDRAYIKKVFNNIVVVLIKNNSNKDIPVSYNPKTKEPFKNFDEAFQYANRKANEVEDLTNREKLK
jgi:hypothetical protein